MGVRIMRPQAAPPHSQVSRLPITSTAGFL